ncbi:stonustoxin subunit alpha-like [Pseudophryne corroboree]|uniref:stonustoxin subunit alpha-like n=1 Tax=Pseudophryne corroboree TaxID=495146 RepID=UPI003081B490
MEVTLNAMRMKKPEAVEMAIEMQSLGRPFSLGMLYDCRTDNCVPGITLWDLDVLADHVASTPRENTLFDITTSDTLSAKSSALNVSASLKLSLLAGMVDVTGSGKFIHNTKASKNQVSVTLNYSRTTKFEQLSMEHLGAKNIEHHEVFDKGTATHVVTGILYGAKAFFTFERDVSTTEKFQEIQGNLEVAIKNIPQCTIDGQGNVEITEEKRKEVKTFSCKFNGDFALESNPVTFEDAVKIYANLPKLLGEKGEKAVPVTVWLYPLSKINSKVDQIIRSISTDLVFSTEQQIQKMIDVTIHCNDLMKHPVAETFPDIKSNIIQFIEQCDLFKLKFKKKLAEILPAIRGGGSEESDLAKILLKIKQSPFRNSYITEFLSRKEQEMDTVSSYLAMLPNISVLPTETERHKLTSDPMIDYVVSFNFTSFNEEETYLSDMSYWLQDLESKIYNNNNNISPWYKDNYVDKKARRCVRAFKEFAAANASSEKTKFIISSVPDQSNPGVSIYLYEGGDLVSVKFEPPAKPNPPFISGRTHDSMELTISPADFGKEFIERYKIEYRSAEEENWSHFITKNKDEKITVTGLKPNTKYQLKYSAVFKPGLSTASDAIENEKTFPTGKPEVSLITADSSSIKLQLKEPTIVGDGVTVTEFKVEYKVESENQGERWQERRSGSKVETYTVDGLKSLTSYIIRVSAICGNSGVSAPSGEILVRTTEE